MRCRTYTLRIELADAGIYLATILDTEQDAQLQRAISHAEDLLNDALPEGFYCKIDETGEGVDLAAVRQLEEYAKDRS